jgi:hypothetical protein
MSVDGSPSTSAFSSHSSSGKRQTYFFHQLKQVAWLMPTFRQISSTGVPYSPCFSTKICRDVRKSQCLHGYSLLSQPVNNCGRLQVSAIQFSGSRAVDVEIFENDVLTHDGSPAEISGMVRGGGLELMAFQPFHDFEGMPNPHRARAKFELMTEFSARGAGRLQRLARVVGRDRPRGGRSAGLRRSGAQPRHPVRVQGAGPGPPHQRLPRRVGGGAPRRPPHVGVILDSVHLLARGLSRDAVRATPADRITFVQLATHRA